VSRRDLLVGVDLGTTRARVALYEPDGTLLAVCARETPLRWEGPGRVDQDPEDFVAAALAGIGDCVAAVGAGPSEVACIGITGQMAGVLGMDRYGRASTAYDSWLDLRCAPELERLDAEHGDALIRIGGCPPMVNHAPKLVWWRRHRPETFARTAKWVMPGGYVAARLAGLRADEAFIDPTYLHFTGLADAHTGTWSPELTAALETPEDQLPRIVEPTTVVGGLTPEAGAACGLTAGTRVAAGLGDTAAAALGAGIVRPGQLLDVAGTAAVLAVSTDRYRPDEDSRTLIAMRGAVAGQWIWLAYLSGGSLLPWLAELLGIDVADDPASLVALAAEAASVPPGAGGLLFVPHLDGRVLPSDPSVRGAWIGLRRDHRRRHLVRAVLESVAYEYAGFLRVVRALDPAFVPEDGRVAGGGARNATWNAIKASVLGVPLDRLDRDELSCWGAALVAGSAVGVLGDVAEAAARATRPVHRHEPVPDERAAYAAHESIYRDAVAMTARIGRRLVGLVTGPLEVPA
jgi:xylulokinase